MCFWSFSSPLPLLCGAMWDAWNRFWTAHDPDDVFAYKTVKVVLIRDRRLGLLHYTFLTGIFLYIFVFAILLGRGYVLREDPVGSVRLQVLQASNPVPLHDLPYCTQSAHSYIFTKHACRYDDQLDVVFPATERESILLSTRLKVQEETWDPMCPHADPECHWSTISNSSYFVADIERFTVKIDHTMSAPLVGRQANAVTLEGRMLDRDGHEVDLEGYVKTHNITTGNIAIGETGKPDIVPVGLLLEAANVDLDDLTDSPISEGESFRNAGVVILIFIDYSNLHTFDLNRIRYTYTLRRVTKTEFKSEEVLYTDWPDGRVLRDRHGIRFILVQTGTIGAFNFQTLLIQFVSGFGLLAVATLFVDTLALMIMPQKEIYQKYKFQRTVDFSDVRDGLVTVDLPDGNDESDRHFVSLEEHVGDSSSYS